MRGLLSQQFGLINKAKEAVCCVLAQLYSRKYRAVHLALDTSSAWVKDAKLCNELWTL